MIVSSAHEPVCVCRSSRMVWIEVWATPYAQADTPNMQRDKQPLV